MSLKHFIAPESEKVLNTHTRHTSEGHRRQLKSPQWPEPEEFAQQNKNFPAEEFQINDVANPHLKGGGTELPKQIPLESCPTIGLTSAPQNGESHQAGKTSEEPKWPRGTLGDVTIKCSVEF